MTINSVGGIINPINKSPSHESGSRTATLGSLGRYQAVVVEPAGHRATRTLALRSSYDGHQLTRWLTYS